MTAERCPGTRATGWLVALDRLAVVHWARVRILAMAITRRFDPAAAQDLEATLELAVRDPHGRPTTRYAVGISAGRCVVRPGAAETAGARAAVGFDDLVRLAGGGIGWPELFSSGRFELTGDPFLALRFAGLFRLPVALGPGQTGALRPPDASPALSSPPRRRWSWARCRPGRRSAPGAGAAGRSRSSSGTGTGSEHTSGTARRPGR